MNNLLYLSLLLITCIMQAEMVRICNRDSDCSSDYKCINYPDMGVSHCKLACTSSSQCSPGSCYQGVCQCKANTNDAKFGCDPNEACKYYDSLPNACVSSNSVSVQEISQVSRVSQDYSLCKKDSQCNSNDCYTGLCQCNYASDCFENGCCDTSVTEVNRCSIKYWSGHDCSDNNCCQSGSCFHGTCQCMKDSDCVFGFKCQKRTLKANRCVRQ